MPRHTEIFASLAVFICASVWGVFWVPIRYFESLGIDGSWTIFLINAPAAIVMTPFILAGFSKQRAHLSSAFWIGLFSGLGLACYAAGLYLSEVLRTTLLFYLTPVWSTFIGIYWLGERVNAQRWIAILLGLSGLALLLLGNTGKPLNMGDAIAFMSGVFWAIAASLIKHEGRIPIAGMVWFQFIFIAIFALAIGYAFGTPHLPTLSIGWTPYAIMAALGVLIFIPAVVLVFWAQQFLFPGRVGLLMMSEVLVAMVTASIFIPEERLSAIQWLSCSLIIAASIVELIPSRRKTA